MSKKHIRKLSHHGSHYIPLVSIFTVATVAFFLFWQDKQFLTAVSVAVSVSYVVWGVMHHMLHDDLSAEVVIEYIIVAVVGLIIMLSVI